MKIEATLKAKTVARVLAGAIVGLLTLAFVSNRIELYSRLLNTSLELQTIAKILARAFSVEAEQNLPTWYSSNALLACALLLSLIAVNKFQLKDAYRFHWLGLAVVFLVMALDEFVSMHENVHEISRLFVTFQSIFLYSWVVYALPFVSVLAVIYFPWWWNLPTRSRLLIAVAACVYIGAAVGLEIVEGYSVDTYGPENKLYVIAIYLEELGEMSGVAVFMYALVDYIYRNLSPITFSLKVND